MWFINSKVSLIPGPSPIGEGCLPEMLFTVSTKYPFLETTFTKVTFRI
jgi:hypothetical protein